MTVPRVATPPYAPARAVSVTGMGDASQVPGKLADLTYLSLGDDGWGKLPQSYKSSALYDNAVRAVPLLTFPFIMYYRLDVFDRDNLTVPTVSGRTYGGGPRRGLVRVCVTISVQGTNAGWIGRGLISTAALHHRVRMKLHSCALTGHCCPDAARSPRCRLGRTSLPSPSATTRARTASTAHACYPLVSACGPEPTYAFAFVSESHCFVRLSALLSKHMLDVMCGVRLHRLPVRVSLPPRHSGRLRADTRPQLGPPVRPRHPGAAAELGSGRASTQG